MVVSRSERPTQPCKIKHGPYNQKLEGSQNIESATSIISIPQIIIDPPEEEVKGQGHRDKKSQHTIKPVVENDSQSDKRVIGSNNFSAQFIKIISHYKKIGYNINVLQQTSCLVVNPITVGNFAFLFNCTPVGRTSDSMMVPT